MARIWWGMRSVAGAFAMAAGAVALAPADARAQTSPPASAWSFARRAPHEPCRHLIPHGPG
jgi:hypothetical protein